MAFSRHTVGDQSPPEPLCLYPDSGSLTQTRNLARGSHLDVLSASRTCGSGACPLTSSADKGRSHQQSVAFPMGKVKLIRFARSS